MNELKAVADDLLLLHLEMKGILERLVGLGILNTSETSAMCGKAAVVQVGELASASIKATPPVVSSTVEQCITKGAMSRPTDESASWSQLESDDDDEEDNSSQVPEVQPPKQLGTLNAIGEDTKAHVASKTGETSQRQLESTVHHGSDSDAVATPVDKLSAAEKKLLSTIQRPAKGVTELGKATNYR